jgi:hypothetical protein
MRFIRTTLAFVTVCSFVSILAVGVVTLWPGTVLMADELDIGDDSLVGEEYSSGSSCQVVVNPDSRCSGCEPIKNSGGFTILHADLGSHACTRCIGTTTPGLACTWQRLPCCVLVNWTAFQSWDANCTFTLGAFSGPTTIRAWQAPATASPCP